MSLRLRAVARPYARALFDVTQAQRVTEQARKELEQVRDTISGSQDFRRFIASPVVKDSDRSAVIREVAKRMSLSKLVTNFLLLLSDKRRLNALEQIITLFNAEADRAAGVVRAEAFAPVKLSAVQVSRLRTALEEMTGRKVVVEDSVDATLMGGLLVKINGEVYDSTVKSQLGALRQQVLRI